MANRKNKEHMFINTVRDAINSDPDLTVEKYAEKFGISSKKEIRSLLKIATRGNPEEYQKLLGRMNKGNKNETENHTHHISCKAKDEFEDYIDHVNDVIDKADASLTMTDELLNGYREDV